MDYKEYLTEVGNRLIKPSDIKYNGRGVYQFTVGGDRYVLEMKIKPFLDKEFAFEIDFDESDSKGFMLTGKNVPLKVIGAVAYIVDRYFSTDDIIDHLEYRGYVDFDDDPEEIIIRRIDIYAKAETHSDPRRANIYKRFIDKYLKGKKIKFQSAQDNNFLQYKIVQSLSKFR